MLVGSWYVIKSQDFFFKPKNCILCLHYYTFSLFRPGIAFFIHGVNQVVFFFMRFSVILEPKLKKNANSFTQYHFQAYRLKIMRST